MLHVRAASFARANPATGALQREEKRGKEACVAGSTDIQP